MLPGPGMCPGPGNGPGPCPGLPGKNGKHDDRTSTSNNISGTINIHTFFMMYLLVCGFHFFDSLVLSLVTYRSP